MSRSATPKKCNTRPKNKRRALQKTITQTVGLKRHSTISNNKKINIMKYYNTSCSKMTKEAGFALVFHHWFGVQGCGA